MRRLSSLMLIGVLCSTERPAAQTPSPSPPKEQSEALIGLWGTENLFGPLVRGELWLDARSPEWRARIGGFDVAAQHDKDSVTFSLPGDSGEFRGRFSNRGKQIAGDWIQGAAVYPYNNRCASPVELSEAGPQVWRGEVNPLEQRLSFYLQMDRSANGLTAFIRNPEANLFRGRTYDVQVKDGLVVLSYKDQRLEGKFDARNQTLLLPVLTDRPPLVFARRDRSTAVGFYPRTPSGAAKYRYQAPVAENDGWKVASLAEVGLDANRISQLIEKVLTSAPSLNNPVNIQSILIARHGKLVLEEYFYGFDKNRPHDMRSASKTYSTMLIGIAQYQGAKIDPQTPVYSLFQRYQPFSNWDERKARMKVRDLMQMTTGYYCDDNARADAPSVAWGANYGTG